MRKYVAMGIAVMAMLATPAMAQDFQGPRLGAEIGVAGDDFGSTARATYGVNAGYDFDLGKVVVGPTVSYTAPFDSDGLGLREWTVGARAGVKAGNKTLVYVSGAYSKLDTQFPGANSDGYRVGLGIERSFGNAYANLETRYANHQYGIELYQTVIGVGYRF